MTHHRFFCGSIAAIVCQLMADVANASQDVPQSVRIIDLVSTLEKQTMISNFRKDLQKIGYDANIEKCDIAIDYVQDINSGRDSSFGAVCRVRSANVLVNLVMCDDVLVGKFTLAPGVADRDELASFIARNCPPGG